MEAFLETMKLVYCEMLCVLCCFLKKYGEVMSWNSDQIVKIGIDTDHEKIIFNYFKIYRIKL